MISYSGGWRRFTGAMLSTSSAPAMSAKAAKHAEFSLDFHFIILPMKNSIPARRAIVPAGGKSAATAIT